MTYSNPMTVARGRFVRFVVSFILVVAITTALVVAVLAWFPSPFQRGRDSVTSEDVDLFTAQLVTRMEPPRPGTSEGDIYLWMVNFGATIPHAEREEPEFWQGFAQRVLEQVPKGITIVSVPVYRYDPKAGVPANVQVRVRRVVH